MQYFCVVLVNRPASTELSIQRAYQSRSHIGITNPNTFHLAKDLSYNCLLKSQLFFQKENTMERKYSCRVLCHEFNSRP